jgi:DNA-binding CsgD family transcriptional regulator
VLIQTPLACAMVAEYFPDAGDGTRLPALLEDWVAASGQGIENEITIEGAGHHLSISLVTEQSLSVVMVSERRKPVTSDTFRVLGLTAREAEVMYQVTQGKTNWEISQILEMGQRTVDKHMEHILEKLGAENRTTALRIAMERCAL